MRTNPEYKHIGETYNHLASDKRQTNGWVLLSMGGMILLGLVYWAFTIIYDSYK